MAQPEEVSAHREGHAKRKQSEPPEPWAYCLFLGWFVKAPHENETAFSQKPRARVTMASLSDKYKKLSHREHVLELPDTYIGSIDTHPQEV